MSRASSPPPGLAAFARPGAIMVGTSGQAAAEEPNDLVVTEDVPVETCRPCWDQYRTVQLVCHLARPARRHGETVWLHRLTPLDAA